MISFSIWRSMKGLRKVKKIIAGVEGLMAEIRTKVSSSEPRIFVQSLFQDFAFPSLYFCRTHSTVRNTFAADCDSFRTLSHAGHQLTPSNSVLLLQFFSLNCFLACIIKISSENTDVCLVCTLLPLIFLSFFSFFFGTIVHCGPVPP